MKVLLHLRGLGMLRETKKKSAGFCCRPAPFFIFKNAPGVWPQENQAPAILSNPTGQADKESADWLVFQQKTYLVNQEVARPTFSTQCSPEPIREQQTGRRDELLAQVAEVEAHDVGPKVDVGGCAGESS